MSSRMEPYIPISYEEGVRILQHILDHTEYITPEGDYMGVPVNSEIWNTDGGSFLQVTYREGGWEGDTLYLICDGPDGEDVL